MILLTKASPVPQQQEKAYVLMSHSGITGWLQLWPSASQGRPFP